MRFPARLSDPEVRGETIYGLLVKALFFFLWHDGLLKDLLWMFSGLMWSHITWAPSLLHLSLVSQLIFEGNGGPPIDTFPAHLHSDSDWTVAKQTVINRRLFIKISDQVIVHNLIALFPEQLLALGRQKTKLYTLETKNKKTPLSLWSNVNSKLLHNQIYEKWLLWEMIFKLKWCAASSFLHVVNCSSPCLSHIIQQFCAYSILGIYGHFNYGICCA